MTYDDNGNLTSVTPPSRPAHEFAYNLADLVSSATAPFASGVQPTTTYAYDDDRNPTKITRPSGDQATISYDDAGRVSSVQAPSGTSSATYSASTGQLATATSEDNQTSAFTFDGPLPTSVTQSGAAPGSIDFDYDADLNLKSLTSPAGETTFAYDNDGLLTRAGALTITRSQASGRVNALTLDGISTTRTYNNFQEPLSEVTGLPGGGQYAETFARDSIGRIETKTETAPSGATTTYAFAYDPAGRLTEVTKNGNPYRAYSFDANGNRTSVTRQSPEGPATEPATYDAQDKQITSGAFDLSYNANGELTSKTNRGTSATQTYSYSTLGALKSVTTPGGAEIAYRYDAQGNRVETRTDGEATQRLLYAPGLLGPVAELQTADREETRFVYASRVNVPDYMVRGGQAFRFVTDQLGSVRFVVDSSTGQIAQEITYDPFGEVVSDSAPGFQPFGFAGGLYSSETGLTHFGAREYDAGLGRWASSDPVSFAGGDSNLYAYVMQDPVNFVDPEGLLRVLGHDVTPSITQASNYIAGFGDAASLNTSARLRALINGGCDPVNKDSGSYGLGSLTGTVAQTVGGLSAGFRAARLAQQFREGKDWYLITKGVTGSKTVADDVAAEAAANAKNALVAAAAETAAWELAAASSGAMAPTDSGCGCQ
jgi:RHS repeat-associated protein